MPTYEFQDPETGERSEHVLEMSEVCGYGGKMEIGGKLLERVFEATRERQNDGFAREELCFVSGQEPRRYPGQAGYDHCDRDSQGRPRFRSRSEVREYVQRERIAMGREISFGEL